MKSENSGIMYKFFRLLDKFLGDRLSLEERGFINLIQRTLRIILGSIRKFLDDEGLLRAATISYSLVVSFVPILVVGLFLSASIIEKDKYYLYAREFIRKHGIPIDLDPYFNIINELLNNANTITGVGFIILFFSATSVLRNIEAAMNTIWRVKKGRPWLQKISGFLLVLIFGPVFITLGMSLGQSLVNRTAASGFVALEKRNNSIVAIGEKASYNSNYSGTWKSENILSRVDFETQNETIIFNADRNEIVGGEEREALLTKIYHPRKKDLYWKTFKSYFSNGNKSWIVTDNGCILASNQSEEIWNIQCFQREDVKLLFKVSFHKIKMFDDENGFILGNDGLILTTSNGGRSWSPAFHENIKSNLRDILKVEEDTFLLVGDEFSAYLSVDSGKHWNIERSIAGLVNKDRANFTSIHNFKNSLWITGDYGTLLHSPDSGKSWHRFNLGITRNEITDILYINSSEGYLLGEKGFLRYTKDGGISWTSIETGTSENLHNAIYSEIEKSTFICGDGSIIMKNTNDDPYVFMVIQKSPFGRAMFYNIGVFLVPFILIAIIFFLVYKIMPYTDVSNKAAFYGASVTSLLYVIFLFGFKYYISSFSDGTFAIYGTLAAIPLSLLLVYASAGIMIYGAEIAFFIQNPGLLKVSGMTLKIQDEKRQMWYGLKILYELYTNFNNGNGSTKESDLIRICHNDILEFYNIMEKFMDRNIIEKTSKKRYAPVVSPEFLKMCEIMEDIDPSDYHVPDEDINNDFRNRVSGFFIKLQNSRNEISQNLTFADLFTGNKS